MYITENVLYEPVLGHHFSATFYRPRQMSALAPAVLLAGSQFQGSQTKPKFQRLRHNLLQSGFLVLEIEPNDTFDWDITSAVDYLVSRPDVDANRLGLACDGARQSGLWMIREPRLAVAVPLHLASMMKTMLLAADMQSRKRSETHEEVE